MFADETEMKAFCRRNWLRVLIYGGLGYCIVDAFLIEPHWIKIDRLSFGMGTYSTPAGPLHVSSGLGTFFLPVRFFCRPEITLIEM